MAFQALIFDVGGLMIPHDNSALARRVAGRCAAPETAVAAAERIGSDLRYETGELEIAHLHARLADELGYAGSWEVFVEDFCSHLGADLQMMDLVERLARTNRVFLFSNTNAVHWPYAVALTGGRLGAFEAHLSHEIGDAKPRLSAYRLLAERTGVEPGRCLFVDDRQANVDAARTAGFQAHLFTDQPGLERFLRQAHVTWPQAAELEKTP